MQIIETKFKAQQLIFDTKIANLYDCNTPIT
jgi:hypothetical protein